MAASPNINVGSLLLPEIGSDGLARESPVIAYTEKVIQEEQIQLRKYIDENYSKIRDVERELENLSMAMKLTSGPKKAALELMRKKIEMSTEKVRLAKMKEEQMKKAWEDAAKAVQDEETIKLKLCEDLNKLVQESSSFQLSRLEELKRRLEALNPNRSSSVIPPDGNQTTAEISAAQVASIALNTSQPASESLGNKSNSDHAGNSHVNDQNQQVSVDVEGRVKKKNTTQGRVRVLGAVPKGRGPPAHGWTGAGFDVDDRH